ncbi:MAG: histidine phosphatase family protein [Anaerolineae bacterium]|nr:histidine phosphatase family protein [Anaerolineae bacterium]
MTTKLILVRHGQTVWNAEYRFRGRADISLDDKGMAQARITARRIMTEWDVSAIYCSPLARARQTAELIAQPLMLHERAHPGLLDIDYGAWQGLSIDEVRDRWSAALGTWFSCPDRAPIPGGETLLAVQMRAVGTINEIVNRHPDKTVVVVGHTVVNRLIILAILDIPLRHFWHIKQDTCAINLIEHDGEHFILSTMNDVCHLEELHIPGTV